MCKQVAKDIKVIGNGDVFDAASAQRLVETTGCDAVLVSRGTMGQPWIIQDILSSLSESQSADPSIQKDCQALLEHFYFARNYQNQRALVLAMRRVGCWYLKECRGARDFRQGISRAKSSDEVLSLIENFNRIEKVGK